MKAPPAKGAPEWVREHVAAKRYAAPGREKIRREAPGAVPGPQAMWTEEGSQSKEVVRPAMSGGGGMSALAGAGGALAASTTGEAGAPGLGILPHYGLEEFGVRDNLSAAVNVGNGNLVVRDTDVKINAPGVATRTDRFYNELANRWGAYGKNWTMAGGHDIGLEIAATTVTWRGPSGFRAVFTGSGSTWKAPSGVHATLTKNADGTWRVRAKDSGMTWTFTPGGYVTKQADRNGVGLSFTYTPANLVASMRDAAGRVVTYTYDADSRITKISDSAGRIYSYTYIQGRLKTSTNPDGVTTTYGYDYNGRLTSITTGRGVRVEFTFDTGGRVLTVSRFTDLNGGGSKQTTTFAYPSATTTTQTDPRGNTWTYTLDGSGRVASVKDPLGRARSQTWTANSSIASATDAMGAGGTGGNVTKYTYDAANNPTQVAMPTGAISSALYTTGGACGAAGTASPDQPTCITDDAGNSAAMRYDPMGNLLSTADVTSGGTGASVSYTYQRAEGATTGTDCGGMAGQRCSATDANGNVTRYTYDKDGNMITATPPGPLGQRRFEYDSLGRLIASTNGRGQRVTYVYDAQDRLLSTSIPSAPGVAARTFEQSWDPDGNMTFNDSVISYDAQNRQLYVKDPSGVGYSTWYDPAGNVGGVNGDGQDHRYSYDAANQLTTAGLTGVSCTSTLASQSGCAKFTYDNNGNEIKRWLPGAVVTTTRDASGRPTRIQTVASVTTLYDLAYSYQKPGTTGAAEDRVNVQTVTDAIGVTGAVNGGSTTTYSYDSKNRLTQAVEKLPSGSANASWAYSYDKAGNRTGQTRAGSVQAGTGTVTYGYNAAHQLINTSGNTAGWSYDADGNETSAVGDDWVNVWNRTAVNSPIGDQTSITAKRGGGSYTYDYGYAGTNPGEYRMTWAHGNALTYSPMGLATNGDEGGGTMNVLRTPSGTPLALIRGGDVAFFIQDRLGSTIGLVDAAGGKVASYAYDPYGNIRSAPGQNVPIAWWNPYLFTGAYRDHQTGLYRMGVRWYDANTGRFTTPDPTAQETNPYLYAGGNPCNLIDPTGGIGGLKCGLGIAGGMGLGALAGLAVAGIPTLGIGAPQGAFIGGLSGAMSGAATSCFD